MTIGLFPLNVVLLPGAQMPLHIFEPRYKLLINECIEHERAFGMNLVEGTHMHAIGCTARVVRVLKRYADGTMDIVVEGDSRYTVLDVHKTLAPYVMGDVEHYDDDEELEDVDSALLHDCATLFATLMGLVYSDRDPFPMDELLAVRRPSFIIALKSGLDVKEKQRLLEMRSEDDRLRFLRDHLTTMIPTVEREQLVQRVIANNGYIIPRRSS